jgi:hypothetical protein
MQTNTLYERAKVAIPFVGRTKQTAQLEELHSRKKHTLILGPEGVGKTAIVNHLKEKLNLIVSPQSERFVAILDSLEAGLGLTADGLKVPQRKRRLLPALVKEQRTVVFDGVSWMTPRLSYFLECIMERVPMWICTRSEHSWDIGHFWTLLVRFEKVELALFHPQETRQLVSAAVDAGKIPPSAINIVEWLHRRANGNPLILCELFEELAAHVYDLNNPHALRRLDLDRRIHEVFPLK